MFFRRFVKTFNKWIDRHRKNVVLFECPKENDDFQQGERRHGCAPSRGIGGLGGPRALVRHTCEKVPGS